MALKVIGAGLGRTGTYALKHALEQIGYGPCYHMAEVIMNPQRRAQWEAIAAGKTPDWDAMFEGYSASVDWPACNYYREIMVHYPDAKIILTSRPADVWYDSASVTIFTDKVRGFGGAMLDALFRDSLGADLSDRAAVTAAFDSHNEEVRAHVPASNLLEFSPAEGWGPLCDFLGVAVPETPFPRMNTREEYVERLKSIP